MMHAIGDFFLSVWIWNITFAWFYPLLVGGIMFLMLRIVLRRQRMPALLITVVTQCATCVILYSLAYGILIHALNWSYEPFDDPLYASSIMNELYASLSLGFVYALFQTLLFFLARFIWRYNVLAYSAVAWISGGIATVLSYLFIRMMILWQYTA